MDDVERILTSTLPFVEELLEKYGEFYPVGTAIMTDNSWAQIDSWDGDDFPISTDVIPKIKANVKADKEDYRTIMIFYDIKVTDYHTNEKTDAVAVFVESKTEDTGYTFFYPYKLTNNKLSFSKSWQELNTKEIFI